MVVRLVKHTKYSEGHGLVIGDRGIVRHKLILRPGLTLYRIKWDRFKHVDPGMTCVNDEHIAPSEKA